MALLPHGLRLALRRWRHRPGLALTATLVLALGIGATTAMYSIVDAVILNDEPWPEANRLVRVFGVSPKDRTNPSFTTRWNRGGISWASWRDLQKQPAFTDVALWVPDQFVIGDDVARVVTWKGGPNVSRLAGQPVRLLFQLRDADLYSFQFNLRRPAID